MTDACPYAEPYKPEFHRDPDRVYQRMRDSHGPVVPAMLEPGVRGWLVVDYATIIAWCRDTATFSRDARRWSDWREGLVSEDAGVLGMMEHRPNVLFADGAEHRRLRRAVTDSFGRIDSAEIASYTARVAESLVDGFCQLGEADILDEYARVLPLMVMNRIFGFDEESGRRFITALAAMMDAEDSERANAELERVVSAVIARKRKEPGEDVTSWLMDHRAGLSDEEVLQHLVLIVGAGTEPTASLIGNAMRIILTDPAFRDEISGGRMGVEDAVEHVLWRDPPLIGYPVMYPVTDVSLPNGGTLPAGSPVLLGYGAANRAMAGASTQEEAGATANRAHLSFGVGPHRCPAQDLATMIATTGISTLLRRLPGLRLAVTADELEWRSSPFSRSLTRLPVTFTPQNPTQEEAPWKQSPSSLETSMSSPDDSAIPARWSLSGFLAMFRRGR
ncbi:cytochrome P450 family protein [Streptomonospora wellingtoniae]|uniref:Cytochrome P450 n=1 Tax=Streptomonospora wellingtoniae TaxID=3075544 RepID=A0ABU2KNF6_9ACTN|nr:cytochrome P450 [Streptomonospora sp. DSM 45055]MDT0300805.1 cytochrome P450 [Streptomonospora sp. DSM 45055]